MFEGRLLSSTRQDGNDSLLQTDGMHPEEVFRHIEAELGAGRRVWISGELFETLTTRFGHTRNGKAWIVVSPRGRMRWQFLCRMRDLVSAVLSLLILSPLLALAVILIKLSSPGPVFQSTYVIGGRAKPFKWLKFRSMHQVPDERNERRRRKLNRGIDNQDRGAQGVVDEGRFTRVGRVLRRYGIDGLPQLYNVLRGKMTLVGPRPCLPYEAEAYPDWAWRRFRARPGLTGMWRLYGHDCGRLHEVLAMDLYYMYARSFWLDLHLLFGTLVMVLKGRVSR